MTRVAAGGRERASSEPALEPQGAWGPKTRLPVPIGVGGDTLALRRRCYGLRAAAALLRLCVRAACWRRRVRCEHPRSRLEKRFRRAACDERARGGCHAAMAAAAGDDAAQLEADESPPAALLALVAPHVASFDYLLSEGLSRVEDALPQLEVVHPGTGARLSVWLQSLRVGKPMREETRSTELMREPRVFPRECRQAGTSYTAPLTARVCWQVEGGDEHFKEVRLSDIPVMVRAATCCSRASRRPARR